MFIDFVFDKFWPLCGVVRVRCIKGGRNFYLWREDGGGREASQAAGRRECDGELALWKTGTLYFVLGFMMIAWKPLYNSLFLFCLLECLLFASVCLLWEYLFFDSETLSQSSFLWPFSQWWLMIPESYLDVVVWIGLRQVCVWQAVWSLWACCLLA